MIRAPFSRDDIFISYSRADGGLYVTGLADRLTAKGFSCYIDKLGTEPDRKLPRSLRRKIANCTMFVLVGTPAAAASAFVQQEVEAFLQTKRTIVPIDFGGSAATARWSPLIVGLALESESDADSMRSGDPSESVVSRIEKAFRYTRRNQLMLRTLWVTALAFVVLAGAGLAAAYWASLNLDRANRASDFAETQTQQAERKSQEAAEAGRRADDARGEAVRQQEAARRSAADAAENASIARNRLVDLSQEQGRLELLRGNRQQALVYLTDAYGQRANDEPLRFLLGVAERSLARDFPAAKLDVRFRGAARSGDIGLGVGLELSDVQFSPDGSRIVTASEDRVQIWDAATARLLHDLKSKGDEDEPAFTARFIVGGARVLTRGHDGFKQWDVSSGRLVRTVVASMNVPTNGEYDAINPAGTRLATAGSPAAVYDVESGRRLFQLKPQRDVPICCSDAVAFSPDGTRIVTLFRNREIDLWNAADGRHLFTLEGSEQNTTNVVTFSPDGRVVAAAGNDTVVRIWEVDSGRLLHALEGHRDAVRALAFSPDGTLCASGSVDRTVRLWNARDSFTGVRQLTHSAPVQRLVFGPNSRRLVALTNEPEHADATLWDVDQGREVATLPGPMTAVVFSPDGERFLTTNPDDEVTIWNARPDLFVDGPLAGVGDDVAASAVFSQSGERLAVARDGRVEVWDMKSRRALRAFATHTRTFEGSLGSKPIGITFNEGTFSPDGNRIALPSPTGVVQIVDVATGRTVRQLDTAPFALSASFDRTGDRIVTVSTGENTLFADVWDVSTGRRIHRLLHERPIAAAVFNATGRLILTSNASGRGGTVWNATTGRRIGTVSGAQPMFSPDGHRVSDASTTPLIGGGGLVHEVVIHDADAGRHIRVLRHPVGVQMASYSPDGRWLVTAGFDATARLWDAERGTVVRLFGGHDTPVTWASFSPEGGRVVTGDATGVVRVWDAHRGQVLAVLRGHAAGITAAAFSGDGNYLATIADATDPVAVRLWDVHLLVQPYRDLLKLVERWVPSTVMSTTVRADFTQAR